MTRPYEIQFVHHRYVTVQSLDTYRFKPKGRFGRLQRLLWRWLEQCGAVIFADEAKVERHVIDADKFMESIFKQQRNLFEHFHLEGQRLLIGAEDYAELMRDPEIVSQYFSFNAEIGLNRKIVGLEVEVIPWMRGALVMPKTKPKRIAA